MAKKLLFVFGLFLFLKSYVVAWAGIFTDISILGEDCYVESWNISVSWDFPNLPKYGNSYTQKDNAIYVESIECNNSKCKVIKDKHIIDKYDKNYDILEDIKKMLNYNLIYNVSLISKSNEWYIVYNVDNLKKCYFDKNIKNFACDDGYKKKGVNETSYRIFSINTNWIGSIFEMWKLWDEKKIKIKNGRLYFQKKVKNWSMKVCRIWEMEFKESTYPQKKVIKNPFYKILKNLSQKITPDSKYKTILKILRNSIGLKINKEINSEKKKGLELLRKAIDLYIEKKF